MTEPSLDKEFMQDWSKLTIVQKESPLSVVKSFFQINEPISLEQYNKEIEEAVAQVEKGDFYTQEEAEQTAKDW